MDKKQFTELLKNLVLLHSDALYNMRHLSTELVKKISGLEQLTLNLESILVQEEKLDSNSMEETLKEYQKYLLSSNDLKELMILLKKIKAFSVVAEDQSETFKRIAEKQIQGKE